MMKRFLLAVVIGSALSGCAVTPPTPAFQLTDAQLCAESGHAMAQGNTTRLSELMAEGDSRVKAGRMTLDQGTCQTLAQTGANAAQNEAVEAQRQQAAWAAVGQMGQQMQAQAAADQQYQQQQMNQQMQSMQQTQALNNIANSIRGY